MAKMTDNANDSGSEIPPNHARFEVNECCKAKSQSIEQNRQVVRMDCPVTGMFTFRAEIRYVWNNGDDKRGRCPGTINPSAACSRAASILSLNNSKVFVIDS